MNGDAGLAALVVGLTVGQTVLHGTTRLDRCVTVKTATVCQLYEGPLRGHLRLPDGSYLRAHR